jgi:hypothetical protein
MDLQLLGGHYGHSSGDLNFAATLSTQEQDALRSSLAEIKADPFKFTYTVNCQWRTDQDRWAMGGDKGSEYWNWVAVLIKN